MNIAIAIICLIFGLSFAYKSVMAIFLGRTQYWEGWLPLSIISPLFIHLPAGKNSLIRTVCAPWVHITLGPIYFLISVVFLTAAADQAGLPGTEIANSILTFGKQGAPPAITYDRRQGYSFPIFKRAADAFFKSLTTGTKKPDENTYK